MKQRERENPAYRFAHPFFGFLVDNFGDLSFSALTTGLYLVFRRATPELSSSVGSALTERLPLGITGDMAISQPPGKNFFGFLRGKKAIA